MRKAKPIRLAAQKAYSAYRKAYHGEDLDGSFLRLSGSFRARWDFIAREAIEEYLKHTPAIGVDKATGRLAVADH